MSVNVPVNPQQRDRDVENKLRLYGIYNAFANGKLPTNEQIDIALTSFANNKILTSPNSKLSDEGKSLLQDFRGVIEEAKRLLLTKNHDQALQEFIWNVSQLSEKGGPQTELPGVPKSKEEAQRDQQNAVEGLKTLGQLIITNGQFRKLLNDATILLRSIAGDAATNTASRVRPSDDQLNQIDDPAPDNEWHDTPNLNREQLRQQARDAFRRNKPIDEDDAREIAGQATQHADPHGSRDPAETADRARYDAEYDNNSGIDAQRGLRTGAEEFRQRAEQNIPEEHKERARGYREKANRYLSSKLPEERRERTIYRLKKMIVEIQGHRDYRTAIDTLLDLAEQYSGHTRQMAAQGSQTVRGAHGDSHLRTAEQCLKALIERFANNTSADDFMEALNDIYADADRDPELKNWFKSVNRYIRKCLQEQGYILQDEANQEYNQLYDHGNFLLRDRYREHTDRLMDEVKFLGEQFQEDPDNKRFAEALQKFFRDIGTDENGKAKFKPHLFKDITQVILPDIIENTRYLPVPRIEFSDSMVDAVVENLVIESDNLFPNVLEVGHDHYYRLGRRSESTKKQQKVMVSASQIQCDLRDVSYYIKRKQGFPALTDTGVADVFMGGSGFSFKLQLSTADSKDRANFFKVDKVDVSISNLKIKLKQSSHKLLFNMFKPLLLKMMRPALTKVLEEQIRKTFSDMDSLLYQIYQQQKQIENELRENPDPENVQNLYNRYMTAAQREFERRRKQVQEAREKMADKKANVATTTKDSIFPDVKLPGGISTRATHYKEEAAKGDRWTSPVFSIGSANPTIGEITPAQVTRKSPFAKKRTVRERGTGAGVAGVAGQSPTEETTASSRYSRDSGYHGPEREFAGLDGKGAGYELNKARAPVGDYDKLAQGASLVA